MISRPVILFTVFSSRWLYIDKYVCRFVSSSLRVLVLMLISVFTHLIDRYYILLLLLPFLQFVYACIKGFNEVILCFLYLYLTFVYWSGPTYRIYIYTYQSFL